MNRSTKKIPFAKPSIGRKEIRAVVRSMKSGWLTSGKENQLFEEEFSQCVGSPHALSVNSGTSGLHLALEAFHTGPGDKVIVPAYTFTASAEVVAYCGATLLLADVDRDYNISLSSLKNLLEKEENVKALIVVHIAGHPARMEEITALCREHQVAVIEDCAHAFPVIHKGKALGCWGDAGVYSFYANKTITTGEGGMVVCNDEKLMERMKKMRLHGIDRDVWNRYTDSSSPRSWEYDVIDAGFKYNLTNFQAALGRVQLQKAWKLRDKRLSIARKYHNAISSSTLMSLPPDSEEHSWHLYILRLETEELRDSLMQYLQEKGIGTSLHFIPLPRLTYYREQLGFREEDYPQAMENFRHSLSLPLFPDMKPSQTQYVIRALQEWEKLRG